MFTLPLRPRDGQEDSSSPQPSGVPGTTTTTTTDPGVGQAQPQPQAQAQAQAQAHGVMERLLRLTPSPSAVLDASLRIIDASASYLDFFGLAREDCVGAHISDLPASQIPLNDGKKLRDAIDRAVALRTVSMVEDTRGSEDIYVSSFRIVPIFENDELVYVFLERCNVTQERVTGEAVNAQLNSPDIYRTLVNSVKGIAIFMLSTQGNVATWNDGARFLKGFAASDIIGRHFSIFYSDEDRVRDKPGKELVKCLEAGRLEDEGWRHRKDGSRFWANVIITPVYHAGKHIGFSKVTRDITERKSIEARLISAYEEASHLKSDFLATISHEIRTPMNGLSSAAALLRDTTPLNKEQDGYTRIIADSSALLLQIMNDILDYSKLSSGTFSMSTDIISVRETVNACVQHFQATIKPEVVVSTTFSSEIPEKVKGDPVRFRQILQNLLSNAVKFTECGTVAVNITMPDADAAGYRIHTEIVDTGIGINTESAKLLFEPFMQVRRVGGKQYPGTGLGLAICRSLVEMMGGKIGYEPNPESRGSVFWFTLDLLPADLPCLPQLDPPKGMSAVQQLKDMATGKQLLLVEDNKINQAVILKVLNALGFNRIDAANDGEQAVSILKQKPYSYDVVLMDINMPVLDGVAATVQIRGKLGLDVPIIAMTANALSGDAESYLSKGMTGYVAKPVDRGRLVDVLLSVLV